MELFCKYEENIDDVRQERRYYCIIFQWSKNYSKSRNSTNGDYYNRSKISDKMKTKTLLMQVYMLSVNQLYAQIKITQIWKANTDANNPLKIERMNSDHSNCTTRSMTKGILVVPGKSNLSHFSMMPARHGT